MNKKNYLYEISEPSLIYLEMDKNELDDLLDRCQLDKNRQNIVILLRGKKMRNLDGLFQEFAEAFSFPVYFGKNWPALDECLNDLDWLMGDTYIVGINDIQEVLIDESKKDLLILFKILKNTCLEWGRPKDIETEWGRNGKPFHFLLQYASQKRLFVQERFSDVV